MLSLKSAAFVACVASANAFGLAPLQLKAPLAAATSSRHAAATASRGLVGLEMGNRNRTRMVSTPKWKRLAEKKGARMEAAKHLNPEAFAAYMSMQGTARKMADEEYKHGPEAVARRKSEKK